MLTVENVITSYDQIIALKGVSLEVREGEVLCILGANGAGKSTLINSISGLLKPRSGVIRFRNTPITGMKASRIAGLGIVQVPEGRGIFAHMSVQENLQMGAHLRNDARGIQDDLQGVYDRFPILGERRGQKGGVLSGGEQQMLALGRALMARPKLLLLDEPSMGLAPLMVQLVFDNIRAIAETGVTILLVEQNARLALEISDRAYVLQNGEIAMSGQAADLMQSEAIKDAYLGVA